MVRLRSMGGENELQSLETSLKVNAVVQKMMELSAWLAAIKASQLLSRF